MEHEKRRKTATYYLRVLHRDIGYLLIGLTLVFSLGGILLVYRDTDLLLYDTITTRTLPPGLAAEDIGRMLRLMEIKISSDDGRYILFSDEPYARDGKYDRVTGSITLTEKQLPSLLNKFTLLHRAASSEAIHWVVLVYGVLLAFLAISSVWMFKPSTRQFRRGLVFTTLGLIVASVLVANV